MKRFKDLVLEAKMKSLTDIIIANWSFFEPIAKKYGEKLVRDPESVISTEDTNKFIRALSTNTQKKKASQFSHNGMYGPKGHRTQWGLSIYIAGREKGVLENDGRLDPD